MNIPNRPIAGNVEVLDLTPDYIACRDFNEITRAVAAIPDGRRYSAKEAVRSEIKRLGRALSNADRAVAEALLCRINWPRGYAWPGCGAIARETGFSRRHVIRSRGKLATLSLIVTARATSERGDAELRVTFPGLLGVPEGDVGPGGVVTRLSLPSDAGVRGVVTSPSLPSDVNVMGGSDTGVMGGSDANVTLTNKEEPIKFNQYPQRTVEVRASLNEGSEEGSARKDQAAKPRPTRSHTRAASDQPDPAFDQFWSDYPRKVGKKDARQAWTKLTADERARASAAAPGFATEQLRRGDEIRFIPYPATWLNGRRFDDEITPAATAQRAAADLPAEVLLKVCKLYADGVSWDQQLGPPPDKPGTRVPAAIWAEATGGAQ